jgi:gliding motility-associated-like protein
MRNFFSWLLICSLSTFLQVANAQCIEVKPTPRVLNLACGINCSDLVVKVPAIHSSEDYQVLSIPYQPNSFTTLGTPLTALYVDDRFSSPISIGFPFCFYGETNTTCVIGSNSIITFDNANTGCSNAWKLGVGGNYLSSLTAQPLPFTGTQSCNNATGPKYPFKSIMIAYQDIDPSKNTAVRRIDYRVEGSAPCRKFILNYYRVPLFDENDKLFTGQCVLYESTGIIDVFFENKPIGTKPDPWNGAWAILGVQKDDVTFAAATGKNCTQWSEQNTAYRFMPSGATPLLQSVQFIRNGTVLGTGTASTSANGETTVTYPNYCAVSNNDTIVVRALYKSCANPDDVLTGQDTIFVKKNPGDLLATGIPTNATCFADNGTITVNIPAGAGTPPYQYQIVGSPFQNSNVFTNLITGNYTIFVKDFTGSCTSTINVFVPSVNPLTASATTVATACPGVNNGSITVTAGNGGTPYQYSLNGGAPQNSNVFTGLAAGNYTIKVTDANGCSRTLNVAVTNGPSLLATFNNIDATCAGASNGSIVVNPLNGTAPYQYSLNAGPSQSSNTFPGLASGGYSVTITDFNGCTQTYNTFVSNGAGIVATTAIGNTTCATASNGTITVNVSAGQPPYQYSINGGPLQSSNVFNNLAVGPYTVFIKDGANCTRTLNVSVAAGPGISVSATPTGTSCAAASNGSITINASAGIVPYQYSLNGGPVQNSNVFSNLAAANYDITVTDDAGCSKTITVTVGSGTGFNATAASVAASCATAANGSITVTPNGGSSPYQYSLNGGALQNSNVFNNLTPGNYSIDITDGVNCVKTIAATVAAGPGFNATAATVAATCAVASNGSITLTPSGGNSPYQYSLNGGAQQNSNTFNNLTPGNYNIVITDNAGCIKNITATVAAGPGITATGNPTAPSCNGASNGSIAITPASGQGPYQYQLGNGAFQPGNSFTGLAAGGYSITVKDANNCSVTINVTVPQGANLTGSAALLAVGCNGGNNGQATIIPNNGDAPYQYALGSGGLQGNNIFGNLTAGSYTVAIKDFNNCNGTVNFTITEPTVLNVSAGSQPVLCNGQSNGVITISGSGGTWPYQYSINGSAYQPGNSFNVAAGNYTAYVRDANNCIKNTPVTITEPALLQVNANTTNGTCNGGDNGSITITASGGNGGFQYSIDGTTYQNANTFSVSPGNYTVTVKDGNNCTATRAVTVGLTNDLVLNTRADTAVCEGKPVQLTTNSNATSFAWTPAGPGISSLTDKDPVVTPATTTQYIVTATYGVCVKKDTVIVQVNAAPLPDAGAGGTICFGKTFQLQGSGGAQYLWRPMNLLSGATLQNPVASPNTTTTFYLKVRDAIGCESLSEDTVKVIVTPPIAAYAGPDTTITFGEPYQLNATGATLFSWSPSTGLSNPFIANPVATIFADQVYNVAVSTPDGCKGSATVKLKVYKGPDIYVPTAFSPNGDGVNDVLKVVPVGIKVFDFLRIYNRYGQLIFETKLADIGWEGRFKATEQPAGSYVYVVQGKTEKDKVVRKTGTIILIR